MENNELMTINEGIETAVEIVEAIPNTKCVNKATIFGLGMIAGVATYNYVLKPVGTKVKNWCENRKTKHVATVPKKTEGEVVEPEDFFEECDE